VSYFSYPPERYKDILSRVAEGKTNRVIAKELGLATDTVKKHRTAIYRDLNVHNGAAAVVEAAKKGWINIQP